MLFASASTTDAGGWAVASLDSVPTMRAGQKVTVGFTILQHGVTPVDLVDDPSNRVGIEIRDTRGLDHFYPAVGDGTVGHYLAAVEAPASGTYQWSLRMGWFGPQELGTLHVDQGATTSSGSWPTARLVALTSSAVLAAVAIADLLASRRRHRLALS
jgi:hypothetical protein